MPWLPSFVAAGEPPELTSVDVYKAWESVEPALGTGLTTIGPAGVAGMHPYLHSIWQVALLVLFVVTGLVGLGLTVRVGRAASGSVETSG